MKLGSPSTRPAPSSAGTDRLFGARLSRPALLFGGRGTFHFWARESLPNGVVGEIAIKCVTQMREYLNKPEATAETIRDGWLHTGDLGKVDDEGYLTIVDRKKNIIIRGGENISCLEVEGAIHRHPKVFEAAVFSAPDARLGETVGAAVMLRAGERMSREELCAFLAGHIAKFKLPEKIWLTDRPLIRGATDKIDRRAIRAACLAADGGAEAGFRREDEAA